MEGQSTIKSRIKLINERLKKGEELKGDACSITHDSYAGYTGYKPQWIIDSMNEFLEPGTWGYEGIEQKIVEGTSSKNESTKLAIAKGIVWLKIYNLDKEEKWKFPCMGQSRVTKGDIGDALKGAQTDALKKGLSNFSIGSRAYLGLLKTPAEMKQIAKQKVQEAKKQVDDGHYPTQQ